MILGRVTQHLKEQNWFAVGIELVILVVGVFMGIQVSNWNEERRARMVENDLLQRLHEETQGLLTLQAESHSALMVMVEVQLAIYPVLFSQEPARPLGIYECEAIASSHILRRPPDEIPTLKSWAEEIVDRKLPATARGFDCAGCHIGSRVGLGS